VSLWQRVGRESPLVQLVLKVGKLEAARSLTISVDELNFQIERLRYSCDNEYFAAQRLWIVNKLGQVVRFKYNRGQRTIQAAIDRQRNSGKPVRICLLKARQFGGTTKFEGDIFGDTVLRDSRSSMIIAHSLESAEHIRSMSERYYDRYDLKKPPLKKQTEKSWKLMHSRGGKRVESTIRIDTAENLAAGHSFTLHNLHASEIQKWPHADEIVKGLFPAVPNSSDTMIFFEGTGAGVGSYWYDFCQMAQGEQTDWEFVFVPWFEIEDYVLEVSEGESETILKSLDTDEELLLKMGVSPGQLKWRRREISETYKGDLDSFHQQYPSTADEAFLSSGRPVFPAAVVKKNLAASVAGTTGNLVWKKTEDGSRTCWVDDPYGYWKKWEDPAKAENLYCCGADVAEGIAVVPELGNRGGDFSAGRVFRRDTRRFVGSFHGRVDPDLFAEELGKAADYWKMPIFPEQNAGGGGNLVIARLKDAGVEMLKTPVFGKKRDLEKQDEVGWETFKNTKRIAIDEMTEAIRECSYVDPDREVWYECSTYVRDEKGRTNAQSKKYDDLVMATAITLQADKLMPAVFKFQMEKKKPWEPDLDVPENFVEKKNSQDRLMEENLVNW